jgi:hypothetical protein
VPFRACQPQKEVLRNIFRIGHAARDVMGSQQHAAVMLREELRDVFRGRYGHAGSSQGFTFLLLHRDDASL